MILFPVKFKREVNSVIQDTSLNISAFFYIILAAEHKIKDH